MVSAGATHGFELSTNRVGRIPNCRARSWSPERRAWVTPLAVVERESDLSMAGTAVSGFDIRKHREADRAFRGTGEYFGVAEFTAVPNGMLLVREVNGVNPRVTRFERKILPARHRRLFDG